MSTFHVGVYVDNWQRGIGKLQKQGDGSLSVYIPEGDDRQLPWIVADRDTGVFVKALQQKCGKHVLGCSEMTTFREFWQLWADIKGVKVQMEVVSLDGYFDTLPEPMRRVMNESLSYCWEFGYTGGDPEVSNLNDLAPEARMTCLLAYIETEDWSPIIE